MASRGDAMDPSSGEGVVPQSKVTCRPTPHRRTLARKRARKARRSPEFGREMTMDELEKGVKDLLADRERSIRVFRQSVGGRV